MSAVRYWVWLTSLRNMRASALRLVLEHFGGPMEAYFAGDDEYDSISQLLPKERSALRQKNMEDTQRILDTCERKNIRILTRQDADYPQRLLQIADAPPVLYVRGRLPYVDEIPVIGLVGTRHASVYGLRMAARLGAELTTAGACIVTGLAYGVDGASAKGALLAGGGCIGVLGSAIDVDYPASNRELIADVAATGAVISEFPPGYPTLPENFPRRNRIISGLSTGVCVVEAPRRSGALITADLALEQGRDLFAVPGNADNPGCAGTNALIRDCAKAVMSAGDILVEYEKLFPALVLRAESMPEPVPLPEPEGEEFPSQPERSSPVKPVQNMPKPSATTKSAIDKGAGIAYIDWDSRLGGYSENQQKILRRLIPGPAQVDDIIAETGLPAALVLAELTILSIKGALEPQPGKHYRLKVE